MQFIDQVHKMIEITQKERARIQRLAEKSENIQGGIICHGGTRIEYYKVCEGKTSRYKYLSIKDNQTISMLANKQYGMKIASLQGKYIKYLAKSAKYLDEIDCTRRKCDKKFAQYVDEELLSNKEKARRWAAADYQRSTYPLNEGRKYETKKGDIVRSKAELIIADWLWDNDVPYRYEAALNIPGEPFPIFPDFTVLSPDTCEPIYLEYFGMITDAGYCTDMLSRINKYAKAGIVFGKNLVALFEGDGVPMNTVTVSRTLKQLM